MKHTLVREFHPSENGIARSLPLPRPLVLTRGPSFQSERQRQRQREGGVREICRLAITLCIVSLLMPGVCARGDESNFSPEAKAWAAACKQTPPELYTGAVSRLIERTKAEKLWDKCGLLL